MSAIVGEGTEVRTRVEAIRAAVVDLTQQLEAIPPWLQVGDPGRFADPADADAASNAKALAAELEDRTRELGQALQQLDQILSPVPVQPLPLHPEYAVLLPVRLETRFVRPLEDAAPGTDEAKWQLLVRVEPDPVSLPVGGRAATDREAADVAGFWATCHGDLSTPEAEAAFAALAGRVGAARAAFLLRTVAVDRSPEVAGGFLVVAGAGADLVPPVLGLPHQLEIWGDGVRLASLTPLHDQIRGTFDLAAVRPRADGTIPRTWWNSFSEAEAVGLGCRIVLGESRPFFSSLLCVGVNQRDQEPSTRQVFDAHTAAGHLGTLAPLTPTNTLDGQPTVDLGRDPAPWLAVARQPWGGDLAGLAAVVGGAPLLHGVPPPDTARHEAATALVQALWPVLWQRSLKDIGDLGEDVYRLGEYAGRHLHPFGPFPVLRVGDLPYGVLPVSFYRQWTQRADDPPFEGTQVRIGADHLDLLAGVAGDDLTVRDADAERLLRVLAQTPTAREYGSRHLPPTVVWAALQALIEGIDPADVVARWDAQAATLLDELSHAPQRRYSPLLFVEPWPRDAHPDYQKAMDRYLHSTWGELAEIFDLSEHWKVDGRSPHALARLVRQSLLLTDIEVCRLFTDQVPGPRSTSYLLPLDDPQRMFNDATELEGLGLVRDLPDKAVDLVNGNTVPHLTRYDAVVRQFEDVREAVGRIIGTPSSVTDSVLTGVLDAAGHRTDVWLTAAATRRLRQLTAVGAEAVLGAYGWVDSLSPSEDPTPPTRAGLVHAPSYTQALTAAVLRDHVVHDAGDSRWQMTLASTSVRAAAELADQVRTGIPLGEVLGREIERRFPEPAHVLQLRTQFPARPEWAGRRVCDGQAVLDAAAAALPAWLPRGDLDDLRDALDAYADLLVTDAVHDVVSGRPDAAAEALEAAAGLAAPPELRLLRTPREGGTARTEVSFVIPYDDAWEGSGTHPVQVADPAFARFLRAEIGAPASVVWQGPGGAISLRDLGLQVVDLLVMPAAGVTALVHERIGVASRGTGPAALRTAARLASMLGQPYAWGPQAADVLRGRLTRLRAMADELLAAVSTTTPRVLRRWGLEEDRDSAAVSLQARVHRVGDPAADAVADAGALAERIRTLVPTQQSLPLVCPGEPPATRIGSGWLDEWLPVVAAVRPALAQVEAALLQTSTRWRAAGSDPAPWSAPAASPDGISGDLVTTVAIGPAVGRANGRGIVPLDSWGETVPAPRHTTWTAFGYDAPGARAPQAVLVVVPSFLDAGVDAAEARQAVLTARDLAHARSVTVTPDQLSIAVPTGVLEAVGSAACTLTREAL